MKPSIPPRSATFVFLVLAACGPGDQALDAVASVTQASTGAAVLEGTVTWEGAGVPFQVASARVLVALEPDLRRVYAPVAFAPGTRSGSYRVQLATTTSVDIAQVLVQTASCVDVDSCLGGGSGSAASRAASYFAFDPVAGNPTIASGEARTLDVAAPAVPFIEACGDVTVEDREVAGGWVTASTFFANGVFHETSAVRADATFCVHGVADRFSVVSAHADVGCVTPVRTDLVHRILRPEEAIHLMGRDTLPDNGPPGEVTISFGVIGMGGNGGASAKESTWTSGPSYDCRGGSRVHGFSEAGLTWPVTHTFAAAPGEWTFIGAQQRASLARLFSITVYRWLGVDFEVRSGGATHVDMSFEPAVQTGRVAVDLDPAPAQWLVEESRLVAGPMLVAMSFEPESLDDGPAGLFAGIMTDPADRYELVLDPSRDRRLSFNVLTDAFYLHDDEGIFRSSTAALAEVSEESAPYVAGTVEVDLEYAARLAAVTLVAPPGPGLHGGSWRYHGRGAGADGGCRFWAGEAWAYPLVLDRSAELFAYLAPGVYTSDPGLVPSGGQDTAAEAAFCGLTGEERDNAVEIFYVDFETGEEGYVNQAVQPIEVESGDRLTAIVGAPGLTAVSPRAGATCEATITVSGRVTHADGAATVSANGVPAIVSADGTFATAVPFRVGEHSITLTAQGASGRSMEQVRTLTRPLDVVGLEAPAGALVPEGEAAPLPARPIRRGAVLPLRATLTSCGAPVGAADVMAPPRLVALATSAGVPVGLGTRSVDFWHDADGRWIYALATRELAPDEYRMTIAMPDGSRWDSAFAVTQ